MSRFLWPRSKAAINGLGAFWSSQISCSKICCKIFCLSFLGLSKDNQWWFSGLGYNNRWELLFGVTDYSTRKTNGRRRGKFSKDVFYVCRTMLVNKSHVAMQRHSNLEVELLLWFTRFGATRLSRLSPTMWVTYIFYKIYLESIHYNLHARGLSITIITTNLERLG